MTALEFDKNADAKALISAIDAYVDRAMEALASRDAFALVGLNEAVEVLCQHVLQLSPDLAQPYVEELTRVRDRIDVMGQAMKAQQDEVKQSLTGLGSTRKAAQAYAKNKPGNA